MTTRSRYLDWLARDLDARATPPPRARAFGPDLVIGYATGYGPFELAPFVRSLRAHSKARVALVADDAPDVNLFLDEHGIDRFDAPREAGWAPHLLIARFKHYLAILDAYPDARRVFLCDVRDVAFQGDPFVSGFADEAAPLVFYAETDGPALGTHGANPRWLDLLIGPPMAERLHDNPVVCGGSIMGAPAALRRMIRILLALCAIQRSGAHENLGADQAALNVIAHWDLAEVFVSPNYRRVATIGFTDPPTLAADGALLNRDGTKSPVLHQYDRHAFAQTAIGARWAIDAAPRPPRRAGGLAKAADRLRKSLGKRLPEWR